MEPQARELVDSGVGLNAEKARPTKYSFPG